MATYDMGGFIRQLRYERGVTQEQLCNGLCSVSTLSKIERGQYTPPGYLFRTLMERLGNYYGRYYSVFLNKHDFEIWRKMEAINKAIFRNEVEIANDLLSECYGIGDFNDRFGRQFLLNCKISIALLKEENAKIKSGKSNSTYESDTDYNEWTELALESVHITIPDFDENKISSYMLSHEEVRAIVFLGISYFYQKDFERIIRILSAVVESMDKFCPELKEKARQYAVILADLAESLYEVKRYDDVINICVKGWKFCIEFSRTLELPIFMSFHGKSLVEKGDKQKGRALLRQTYCVAIANGSNAVSEEVKSYFARVFGETLEVCYNYPPC